jgi:hypothetical protein
MSRWSSVLLHPLWLLAAIVPLSLWAQDRAYPLSSFPMYAKNDGESQLVFLAGPDGSPISLLKFTNLTSSKATKLYNTLLRDECRSRRIRITTAPIEVHRATAARFLEQAAAMGREHGCPPLPDGAQLVYLSLTFDGRQLVQTPMPLGQP